MASRAARTMAPISVSGLVVDMINLLTSFRQCGNWGLKHLTYSVFADILRMYQVGTEIAKNVSKRNESKLSLSSWRPGSRSAEWSRYYWQNRRCDRCRHYEV